MSAEKYREDMLITLRADVKFYTDCTEPNKPPYHSLLRLAMGMPGFTGYVNSTAVESWDEPKRMRRWSMLKAWARKRLDEFENGKQRNAGRKTRRQYGAGQLLVSCLEAAGASGLSSADLYEKVYRHPMLTRADGERLQLLILRRRQAGFQIQVIAGPRKGIPRGQRVLSQVILHDEMTCIS